MDEINNCFGKFQLQKKNQMIYQEWPVAAVSFQQPQHLHPYFHSCMSVSPLETRLHTLTDSWLAFISAGYALCMTLGKTLCLLQNAGTSLVSRVPLVWNILWFFFFCNKFQSMSACALISAIHYCLLYARNCPKC